MVTIDSNKSIQPIPKAENLSSSSKTKSEAFDAIFKQEMGSKAAAPAQTESPSQMRGIRPAWCVDESQSTASMAIDRISNLIDTMAIYQNKLVENGATLKEMHGLVQQMTSQSESLASLSEKMEESDGLKAIVNQSLMLSSMEISRYYSGYYVD